MLYIRKGREPNSLTQYKKEKFAYFDGCKKDDIRDRLLEEQGHLCAYCMRRISKDTMKIEHWYPEELLSTDLERLDYSNMLGCCEGHMTGGRFQDDICDTHKKSTVISVNPTDIRSIHKISYKQSNGEIYSEDERIERDLNDTLNLNCNKFLLKENRKALLDAVKLKMSSWQKSGLWNRKILQKVLDEYRNDSSKCAPDDAHFEHIKFRIFHRIFSPSTVSYIAIKLSVGTFATTLWIVLKIKPPSRLKIFTRSATCSRTSSGVPKGSVF